MSKQYLKDYTPLPFEVKGITLSFYIEADKVVVQARSLIAASASKSALCLDGEAKLLRVMINSQSLKESEYMLSNGCLEIHNYPAQDFELLIETELYPKQNKSLQGLYASHGNLFTQCEAQGFRKITYFFDRPDLMTEYRVYIEGDKKCYPQLLSNGNLIEKGDKKDGKHWALWHDPYRKPCYLFALVAGDFVEKKDVFITSPTKKKVTLHFYSRAKDADKLDFAIHSLKEAMAWDEKRFHLEYDLDLYMVVAVDDFNMGAMENKGLNLFNTQFVLATPQTTTDREFADVQAVIAHEYFHNYTGNRVTCRDWFQLTLKEGLTVFREQEFVADMAFSPQARRIDTVRWLREFQFNEDAGPLSHPIRPAYYEEINNFYTATVYEKGAEVIRMLHTILGEKGFQEGMKLYFQRHDGQAVTCEDFVKAMQDANKIDLQGFLPWYFFAGTPVVEVSQQFDAENKHVILHLTQHLSSDHAAILWIPIRLGFLNQEGHLVRFRQAQEQNWQEEMVYVLKERETDLVLQIDCFDPPILSFGRQFSAPVYFKQSLADEELFVLMNHDKDQFIRFESAQRLYRKYLSQFIQARQHKKKSYPSIAALSFTLSELISTEEDLSLLALLLELPSFNELLKEHAPINPIKLEKARLDFKKQLAVDCYRQIEKRYQDLLAYEHSDPFQCGVNYHPKMEAVRFLINQLRSYLAFADKQYLSLFSSVSYHQRWATNMTHRLGLLEAINYHQSQERDDLLAQFAADFADNPLVLDKYFSLIAGSIAKGTKKAVQKLLDDEHFDWTNPNQVRSVLLTFARNPRLFHKKDGSGYRLIMEHVSKIETYNPMLAARLLSGFNNAVSLDISRREQIADYLQELLLRAKSKDVLEQAERIFKAIKQSLSDR